MAMKFVAKLSMASSRRNQEPQDYAIANVLVQVKLRNLCGERPRVAMPSQCQNPWSPDLPRKWRQRLPLIPDIGATHVPWAAQALTTFGLAQATVCDADK